MGVPGTVYRTRGGLRSPSAASPAAGRGSGDSIQKGPGFRARCQNSGAGSDLIGRFARRRPQPGRHHDPDPGQRSRRNGIGRFGIGFGLQRFGNGWRRRPRGQSSGRPARASWCPRARSASPAARSPASQPPRRPARPPPRRPPSYWPPPRLAWRRVRRRSVRHRPSTGRFDDGFVMDRRRESAGAGAGSSVGATGRRQSRSAPRKFVRSVHSEPR